MGTTDTHKSKANWCLNTNRKRNQTEPQIKLKFQKKLYIWYRNARLGVINLSGPLEPLFT